MKSKILVFAAAAAFASVCRAESPEERATMYFQDLQEQQYVEAARHFTPEGLREFREDMGFYKSLPAEVQSEFIQSLFGPAQTVESVSGLSDVQFFAALLGFIMRQAQAAGGLDFEDVEILGQVTEGEDVVHLVTRSNVSVGGVSIEDMEVVSLKRRDEEWRVMLSGRIKGIAQRLEAAVGG